MSLGMSGADWQNLAQEYVNSKRYMYQNTNAQRYNSSGTNGNSKASSLFTVSQSTGNTCTDGVDDGDIGVAKTLYHLGKGVVKGAINGLKGMVTDKNGKFSLAKTLGTVALGAACVAFPAVGLVACGIGVVAGGAKVVTGIVNAANATNDASKKDALENVGDGALTLGLSALGAKASYNGVIKGASLSSKGSAIEALEENASIFQKAGALARDMGRSTSYSAKQIGATLTNAKEALELQRLKQKVGPLTKEEMTRYGELSEKEGVIKITNKFQAFKDSYKAGKAGVNDAKSELNIAKEFLKEVKKSGNKEEIEAAEALVKEAQNALNSAKSSTGIRGAVNAVKAKLASTNTSEYWTNNHTKLTEGGLKNIINNIKANKNNIKFSELFNSLSSDGKAVVNFLKSEQGSYAEAVQKFGLNNVLEALEIFASYRVLDESI